MCGSKQLRVGRSGLGSHLHPPKAEPKNWKTRKRHVNGCSLDIGTSKIRREPRPAGRLGARGQRRRGEGEPGKGGRWSAAPRRTAFSQGISSWDGARSLAGTGQVLVAGSWAQQRGGGSPRAAAARRAAAREQQHGWARCSRADALARRSRPRSRACALGARVRQTIGIALNFY